MDDKVDSENLPPSLLAERNSIDNIDKALICLLAERFKCTQRVGYVKAKHHLPASDPKREKEQIQCLRALARECGLDPDLAEKFLDFMISQVIRRHEKIRQEYDQSS